MQINNFNLAWTAVLLLIGQLLINNLSPYYVDYIGILLVIILLNCSSSLLLQATLLSLVGDLFGHWYLGSHLFAYLLLDFIAVYLRNTFFFSSPIQKYVLIIIFYSFLWAIIAIMDWLCHNTSNHNIAGYWFGVLSIPVILGLANRYILRAPSDTIIC